jgi:hypothetical protein
MRKKTSLDIARIKAIKCACKVAMDIQKDYPGIAQDYRQMNIPTLNVCYGISEDYGLKDKTAEHYIWMALRGNSNPDKGELFEGLIEEEELFRIGEYHKRENLSRHRHVNARRTREDNSQEKATRYREALRKAGKLIFESEEIERIVFCANQKSFYTGPRGGLDSEKIADIVNQQFYEGRKIRDGRTIKNLLTRLGKAYSEYISVYPFLIMGGAG